MKTSYSSQHKSLLKIFFFFTNYTVGNLYIITEAK